MPQSPARWRPLCAEQRCRTAAAWPMLSIGLLVVAAPVAALKVWSRQNTRRSCPYLPSRRPLRVEPPAGLSGSRPAQDTARLSQPAPSPASGNGDSAEGAHSTSQRRQPASLHCSPRPKTRRGGAFAVLTTGTRTVAVEPDKAAQRRSRRALVSGQAAADQPVK